MRISHSTQRSRHRLGLAIMLGLAAGASQAADMIELSLDTLPYNLAGQANVQSAIADPSAINALTAMLGNGDSFAMQANMSLPRGETRERGQQMYRGLRVFGGEFIAARNVAGEYTFVTGNMLRNIARDIGAARPRMNAAQAERIARAPFVAPGVADTQITEPKPTELMVYQRSDGRAVLAYRTEFNVQSPSSISAPVQFIDAMTGEVVFQYNNLQTVEQRGSGPGGNGRVGQYEHGSTTSGLSGPTTVNKSGTTCQLSNSRTLVVNARNGSGTGTTPIAFSCPDTTNRFVEGTINGAFGVSNDILYFGTRVFDFYTTVLNTQPLKCGTVLVQYAHVMTQYDNAFYQNCQMRYGDGNSFYPLTSTDVVAHEISHGVTEGRSNLVYANQSGGLNESFSDMAGTAFTFFLTGSTDFLIGSQISKTGTPLRYMATPSRDGRSIDNVGQFTTGLDPHFGSGPFNRAFFLLATRTGWDPVMAFKVYYTANDRYWTANTTYAQAGEGACRAARDLGFNSADVRATLQSIGLNPTNCVTSNPPTGGTTLQNGVARTGISLATNQQQTYQIVIPAGTTASRITFTTQGTNGDVDLYARFNAQPTTTTFNCKSEGANSNETCSLTGSSGVLPTGTYFILLNGFAAATGVSLTATFQ